MKPANSVKKNGFRAGFLKSLFLLISLMLTIIKLERTYDLSPIHQAPLDFMATLEKVTKNSSIKLIALEDWGNNDIMCGLII
jgi:hypothetical protein